MPARSGDCTSVRNRASWSAGSAAFAVAAALARRALNSKSSILAFELSAGRTRSDRAGHGRPRTGRSAGRGGLAAGAVIRVLVPFDEGFHAHGVLFSMPVAFDGAGAAAGLDQHIREQQAGD